MKNKKILNNIFKEFPPILESNNIICAYIFGSLARGNSGKLSDVDIAVYVSSSLNRYEKFDLKIKLMKELGRILKTDNIDILILNDAPPMLKHRVIKEGKIIYYREKEMMIDFEVRAVMEYLDFLPFIKKHTKEILYG